MLASSCSFSNNSVFHKIMPFAANLNCWLMFSRKLRCKPGGMLEKFPSMQSEGESVSRVVSRKYFLNTFFSYRTGVFFVVNMILRAQS